MLQKESVIQPTRGLQFFDLQDFLQYRDLIGTLVWREFIAKYKQTLLGPAWYLLQPLATTLVFSVVFGTIIKVPTPGVPAPLFYMTSLLLWGYFIQSLDSTSWAFTANEALFQKIYFPRLIVPISGALAKLMGLFIQCLLFVGFAIYFSTVRETFSFEITGKIFLFPILVIQTACIAVGVGLWISSLTARFRDLVHLFSLFTQLWMFATPVIYPFSSVPESWRWIAAINPMTMVIELSRVSLLGVGIFDPLLWSLSVAVSMGLLLSGLIFFSRVERTFMDTL